MIILPNQLFKVSPPGKHIFLLEEPKFFTKYQYHIMKIAYHRATMKSFEESMKAKGFRITYVDFSEVDSFLRKLREKGEKKEEMYEPFDHELKRKYSFCEFLPSPQFLLGDFRGTHSAFYKEQRKRLHILVKGESPIGGKWSFDEENRKRLADTPKDILQARKLKKCDAAEKYARRHFPTNYGEINWIYPVDWAGAKKWLAEFIERRFAKFGPYEDASLSGEPFLYHSVLSPMMNVGLLTDEEVISAALAAKVKIQSKEGFVRQIIGWRNYMLSWYIKYPKMKTANFFRARRKLRKSLWWKGETGIAPLDDIIQNKIVKFAFTHHIERLMFLGCFLFMLGVDPAEVYTIFMEWTIDAYEWVMVPNIFGMSQHAFPDLMRKPYLCGSNYILKMSNYKKGAWTDEWDSLYYNFIDKHADYFAKTPYNGSLRTFRKKPEKEQREIRAKAKSTIARLTKP